MDKRGDKGFMRPRNRRIGDVVREQFIDVLQGWRFDVTDHDDARDWPGDLTVGNGWGMSVFVEVKAIRDEIHWGPSIRDRPGYVRPRTTFPGRPLVTQAGHERLLEYEGLYVFCVYHMEGESPRMRKALYAEASWIHSPALGRRFWAVPWRIWQRCPPLTREAIVRRLMP